jgi:hypothetical protein
MSSAMFDNAREDLCSPVGAGVAVVVGASLAGEYLQIDTTTVLSAVLACGMLVALLFELLDPDRPELQPGGDNEASAAPTAPDPAPAHSAAAAETARGAALVKAGDLDSAQPILQRRAAEGDHWAALWLGMLLTQRGELAAAEPHLRSAVIAGVVEAARPLGNVLAARGDLDGAEGAFRYAVAHGDAAAQQRLDLLAQQRHPA